MLVSHFPSQNPAEHACFRSLLQRTFLHLSTLFSHVLLFPPAFSFPVLLMLVSHFPSQNTVGHARSSVLFHISLSFPLMYFFSLMHFLFPILLMLVRHFPSQNPVEHAHSRSLLQHTFPHLSILSFHVLSFPPTFPFSCTSHVSPALPLSISC